MMKPRLLFAVFFAAALLCAAQTKFPDTPAAHQFSAWLNAFNSGDRVVLLEFLQKNNPSRAADIDQELGFRTQTGGFEFKEAEESAPTRLTGIVKERASDQFARFTIEVESAEPHRVKQLELRAIPPPAEFPMSRMSQDAALTALRAEVEKAAAADRFSGTILIAKDGKPIFAAAYGLAEREKKISNKLDTRFRLGSMNK